MLSAVIEGMTIYFITSLATVKFAFKRNESTHMMSMQMTVMIMLLNRYALVVGRAQFVP